MPSTPPALRPLWPWTLAGLVLILAWDASGLDLPMAAWFGTASGFPWREQWFLVKVLHEGMRFASWALIAALVVAVWRPFGFLRRLSRLDRAQLAAGTLLAVMVVSVVKNRSHTSCPWELQQFGGMARYVSHWAWGIGDGGGGMCFPAGHASAAFAYLGGFFALRRTSPTLARRWLAIAVAAGVVLGFSQQLRGAHYMSHTLWTAWICWTVGLLLDGARTWWEQRHPVLMSARAGH